MADLAVFRLPLDRPAARPETVSPEGLDRQGALIWVDVAPDAEPDDARAALGALKLPGLDAGLVEEWLHGDTTGPAAGERVVTLGDLAVTGAAGATLSLSVRPLRIQAGSGWMLTMRGAPTVEGQGPVAELTRETLLQHVERHWRPWPAAGSDDLATILLMEITAGWPPALERLAQWQGELEREYLEAQAKALDERTDDTGKIHASLASLRRQILAADREVRRLARPGRDPASAWFRAHKTVGDAMRVAGILSDCRAELAALLDAQRSTQQLIAARAAVEQLQLTEAAGKRGQVLQQFVGWLTGVLLLPTLVATVLGALPALFENCPTARLALVVGATLGTMALGAWAARRVFGFPPMRPE